MPVLQQLPKPGFTQDWSSVRSYWPDMFRDLKLAGKPNLRFLEIGCFEGKATVWLLSQILTHPTSAIDVIDTFEGSAEFEAMGVDGDSLNRFLANTEPYRERVTIHRGDSKRILLDLRPVANWIPIPEEAFDFIYVDASHMAADVLADAVLAWPLLKPGCVMVFDDYDWGLAAPEWEKPKIAIDSFVACYSSQLRVLHRGYQFVVEKL